MIGYDYNMGLATPMIILCTRYHHNYGAIRNIANINSDDNMSSANEFSFDVYKDDEVDDPAVIMEFGNLWNKITDGKYIYVPEKKEYYEITVTMDEAVNTIKHVTATSACEAELDNRLLRNLEINTKSDIAREAYKEPTKFYNPKNPDASLLHRVLHDKASDYTIAHVDATLVNIQRSFSADKTSIYKFLTETVAKEIECLFIFNSVDRSISVYDLKNICDDCGHRGDMIDTCPSCGSKHISMGYGKNTGIFLSSKNYAESISMSGKYDEVKNCFKIEGGDDLMTATVINCNPNGSGYIYTFSDEMLAEMPKELVQKIDDYNEEYAFWKPRYDDRTNTYYELLEEQLRLQTMTPSIEMQDTTAKEQLDKLTASDSELSYVVINNTDHLSQSSADLAVKNYAKVLVDMRYDVKIVSSSLNVTNSKASVSYYGEDDEPLAPPIVTEPDACIWKGIIQVVNNSDEEDVATATKDFTVRLERKDKDYEEFLHQKIMKALDRDDMCLQSIFKIEDLDTFKTELKKYGLTPLNGFESAYQKCLEVMIENGMETDYKDIYGVNVYEEVYIPYYNKLCAIQAEEVIRERELDQIRISINNELSYRKRINDKLNFQKFIGDELWSIFCLYLKEDTYDNSNYISDGLDNKQLLERANELFNAAKEESERACQNQISFTTNLNNILQDDNFKEFRSNLQIGNWLRLECDGVIYKLRLVKISINYSDLKSVDFEFSNVIKAKNVMTDAKDLLSRTKSIAGSFNYVAHQASQGSDASDDLDNMKDDGIVGDDFSIYNDSNQEVTIDSHGISCKQYDDVTEEYSPKQMRIINNVIAFTKDNWESVETAIGEIQYSLGDEIFYDYGVKAKTIVSGKFIGGDIYSSNYKKWHDDFVDYDFTTGSHFDLNNGSIELGNDLLYTKENGLEIKGKLSFAESLYVFKKTPIKIDASVGEDTNESEYIYSDPFEFIRYDFDDDRIYFRASNGSVVYDIDEERFFMHSRFLEFQGQMLIYDLSGEWVQVDVGMNDISDIADGTITGAIKQCFQSVSDGKQLIADAITDKGIETSATDTFQTMADNISQISGGGRTLKRVHMPILTSNDSNTDIGLVKVTSSIPEGTGYWANAYMAFRGYQSEDPVECFAPGAGAPQWLQLEFARPFVIKSFEMANRLYYIESPRDVIFQGSNDGEDWDNITAFIFSYGGEANHHEYITTDNSTEYRFYRWYIPTVNSNYAPIALIDIDGLYEYIGGDTTSHGLTFMKQEIPYIDPSCKLIYTVWLQDLGLTNERNVNISINNDLIVSQPLSKQMNGLIDLSINMSDYISTSLHNPTITIRSDNDEVGIVKFKVFNPKAIMPKLTSNSTQTDLGLIKVTGSSGYSDDPQYFLDHAYMAFDGIRGDFMDCFHPERGLPQWLQLEFERPFIISDFIMMNRPNYIESPKHTIFQGSSDGVNWVDIYDIADFNPSGSKNRTVEYNTNNTNAYKYYRWYFLTAVNNYAVVSEIEITGLADPSGANETEYWNQFENITKGKTMLANAITLKGVYTSASNSFNQMADNISRISTGSHGGEYVVPMLTDQSLFTLILDNYTCREE